MRTAPRNQGTAHAQPPPPPPPPPPPVQTAAVQTAAAAVGGGGVHSLHSGQRATTTALFLTTMTTSTATAAAMNATAPVSLPSTLQRATGTRRHSASHRCPRRRLCICGARHRMERPPRKRALQAIRRHQRRQNEAPAPAPAPAAPAPAPMVEEEEEAAVKLGWAQHPVARCQSQAWA